MREIEIKETENYLKEQMQFFQQRTGIQLQESTVQKALSIIIEVDKKYGALFGQETVMKVTDALDCCQTEEELLIAINKISPPYIPEDERIYLNIPYTDRYFARFAHCEFDKTKKLWFVRTNHLLVSQLIARFGMNEATSEEAMAQLKAKTEIQ